MSIKHGLLALLERGPSHGYQLRARCEAGAAGVLVTHDARHAAWADRVVFLRDGVVVDQSGPAVGIESLLAPGGAR